MPRTQALHRVRALALIAYCAACVSTDVQERCRFLIEHVRRPPMAAPFIEVDRILVSRMIEAGLESRELRGALARSFRIGFAQQLLPELCIRLERARSHASAGQALAAGRIYQSLLLASQIGQLTLAIWRTAEAADTLGQPSAQISTILEVFAASVRPLLDAALTEHPSAIARALNDSGPVFATWIAYLERWSSRLESSAARVKTAHAIWQMAMLVLATHEAASAAAGLVQAGPPSAGALRAVGSAEAALVSQAAYLELAASLRKLIASGALDAPIIAGLGAMLDPRSRTPPALQLPQSYAMAGPAGGEPSNAGRLPSSSQAEADGLEDVARFRTELGLPIGKGTIARLDVGGRRFYGISAHGQEYEKLRGVTYQTLRHAEGDAFLQALRTGARGGKATLFVDRTVCGWCVSSLRSFGKQLGIESLTVVQPGGSFVVVP